MERACHGRGASVGCFSPLHSSHFFAGGDKNSVLAEDQEASWILDSVPWKLESAVEVLQFGGSVTQWAALSFPNGLF